MGFQAQPAWPEEQLKRIILAGSKAATAVLGYTAAVASQRRSPAALDVLQLWAAEWVATRLPTPWRRPPRRRQLEHIGLAGPTAVTVVLSYTAAVASQQRSPAALDVLQLWAAEWVAARVPTPWRRPLTGGNWSTLAWLGQRR